MKINFQTSGNECGICVLKSVYEFLYKKEIDKEMILQNYTIDKSGISIYDFEILGSKINISFETYEIEYSDFMKLKYDDYFITVINNDFGKHFVICKKTNNKITIFDSIKGKYQISLKEFEKIYNNIVIVFSKKILKEEELNISKLKFFDFPIKNLFALVLIFADILILCAAIINSNLLKISLSFIDSNELKDFVFLVIFFILTNLFELGISYWISLIKSKIIEEMSKRNVIFYLNYLNKKNYLFFKNTEKKIIYQYPIDIGRVLNNKYILIPNLISDCIFFVILSIMISWISVYILLFGIAFSFCGFLISYLINKYNMKNYNENELLKNEIEINFQQLYTFFEQEINAKKMVLKLEKCKRTFFDSSKQNIKNTLYYSLKNFFLNLSQKMIYLFFISFSIYWLMTDKKYIDSIEQLLLVISLLNFFDKNVASIMEFTNQYSSYCNSKKHLTSFLNYSNKNEEINKTIIMNDVEKIGVSNLNFSYNSSKEIFQDFNFEIENNTLLYGQNGIGKSTLLRILALQIPIEKNHQIFFNDLNYTEFNFKELSSRIIYIPDNATPIEVDYSEILHNNPRLKTKIVNFIKLTKLSSKKVENMSKGEIQLTNLVSLLAVKDHVIFLDESFANISKENINYFMENFFETISNNNFLVCVSHSEYLKKFFKNVKELKNEKQITN